MTLVQPLRDPNEHHMTLANIHIFIVADEVRLSRTKYSTFLKNIIAPGVQIIILYFLVKGHSKLTYGSV